MTCLPILTYDVDEDKTMYKEFYDLKAQIKFTKKMVLLIYQVETMWY